MIDDTSGSCVELTRSADGAVRVVGDLDPSGAEQLAKLLQSVPVETDALCVDLRAVNYLDSAGVSVLFSQARRGLRILVLEGSVVATVVRICGLAAACQVEVRSG